MYEDDEKLAETLAGPGISRSAGNRYTSLLIIERRLILASSGTGPGAKQNKNLKNFK